MTFYFFSNKPHSSLSYKGEHLSPVQVFYPGVRRNLQQQQPLLMDDNRDMPVEDTDSPPPCFSEYVSNALKL